MRYQLPRPAIKAYEVGFLHAAYRVGRTQRPRSLFTTVSDELGDAFDIFEVPLLSYKDYNDFL